MNKSFTLSQGHGLKFNEQKYMKKNEQKNEVQTLIPFPFSLENFLTICSDINQNCMHIMVWNIKKKKHKREHTKVLNKSSQESKQQPSLF